MPNAGNAAPWKPLADDELTWFPYYGVLPSRPRPLEYTLAVEAFRYGLGHALDSLNFPLHDVRTRLVDGQLYLASVPSAMAEADLDRRMLRMRDATIRFSRNIRASWERGIRREVEQYTERMAAFSLEAATPDEAANSFFALKRVRANQWFAPIRAVFAPAAMLQAGIGETPPDEAMAVVQEVRDLVITQGTTAFEVAIRHVADHLVHGGCIDAAGDMVWLEYDEVRIGLEHGTRYQATAFERRSAGADQTRPMGPATIGPPLPTDAPRMYLLREILDLIDVR